jgi:putative phosphoribosyl transferase
MESLLRFRDRTAAGRRLAVEVGRQIGIPTAVAAVSEGGGEVARPLARAFARPLTFAYCAPLFLPWDGAEDATFGAVDPDGEAVFDYTALAAFRLSHPEIEHARRHGLRQIHDFYTRTAAVPLDAALPTTRLLLVDDGLSPGWRMEAAVALARRRRIARVIVATVSATRRGAGWFREDADGFVSLTIDDAPAAAHFEAASGGPPSGTGTAALFAPECTAAR